MTRVVMTEMKIPFYILKVGYRALITHIRNTLSLYFPCIFSSRPQAVDIYPTFRCNLKCIQCNCWRHKSKDGELSTDKWKEIIMNLKKWLGPFFRLRICGGEPLVRRDLIDIIAFAHQQEIFTFLATNGTLISGELAEGIIKSRLDWVSISLDSLKEKTYDYLRGEVGTYRRTRQAIRFLQGRINTLQIHTTIMRYNLDEIMDLVRFCEDNRLLISFQGLYGLRDGKTGFRYPPDNDLWPQDRSKIRQIFDELLARKTKGRTINDSLSYLQTLKSYYLEPQHFMNDTNYHCLSYERNFKILHNGTVKFCPHFDAIGNVTTVLPQKIWRSKEAFRIREKMKKCHRSCAFMRSYYNEGFLGQIAKFRNLFLNRLTTYKM